MKKQIFFLLVTALGLQASLGQGTLDVLNDSGADIFFGFYQDAADGWIASNTIPVGGHHSFTIPVDGYYASQIDGGSGDSYMLLASHNYSLSMSEWLVDPSVVTDLGLVAVPEPTAFGLSVVFCAGIWLGTKTWRVWREV